ncbi:hypothetical protein F0U62_05465 [Cystobacter fuscus]|uniref:hypothetical protein n=1 Tax=Cystobacter fuscus TaxID=43 RepID=UPI002B30570E|nr:hypothetical protein F0U62_05465 [Cystobacter fuscus]
MLKLAASQLQAISERLTNDFEEKTTRHLVSNFRAELSRHGVDGDVAAFVRKGIAEARSHGITRPGDVRLYLECMLLLRPDFGDSPEFSWASKVLREHGLSGTEKMDQIHDHLVFSVLLKKQEGGA